MRNMEFRAKRKDNGQWIYGSLVHQIDYYGKSTNRYFVLEGTDTNDYDIDFPIEVDGETVCEYTGILDANGSKIFEGDIVENGPDFNEEDGYGVVQWEDGAFEVSGCGIVGTFYENYFGGEFSIVGNIYDNPELLTPSVE